MAEKEINLQDNVNNGQQAFGGRNKFVQDIFYKYGLDEEAVKNMLDNYYYKIVNEFCDTITNIDESIKNHIEEIIANSVMTALLQFDDKKIDAMRKDNDIAQAVKENFNNLDEDLLDQIKWTFKVFFNEAKSLNESVDTAIDKLKNESEYYARCAQESCTVLRFIKGIINDSKAVAYEFFESGCDSLREGEFDYAIKRFEKAIDKDSALKSQADFYIALSNCKIQPIWDSTVRREVPIIHDLNAAWLENDNNYKDAVKYEIDEVKKKYYTAFCAQIKELCKSYKKIDDANVNGKFDYDCFICVKQSASDGKSDTSDFEWVQSSGILDKLSEAGIKAFAAYRDLDKDLKIVKGDDNYNTAILYALQRAKVLLLVCSDSKYAQTPWVKNEYVRFTNAHNVSSVVLVGTNKKVEIPKVSNEIQVIDLEEIDRIVDAVKTKVEYAKNYVDSDYYYCEKCGHKYQSSIGKSLNGCVQEPNNEKCNGRLISAVDYSNRCNEALQTRLHDTEKALTNEKEKRESAESEVERLRNEMPVTDEVAAARYEEAQEMMREAEQRIEQSVAVKEQLNDAWSRCSALQDERGVLKAKFAFILIAVLSVALAICALVVTFNLPLQYIMDRYYFHVVIIIWVALGILLIELVVATIVCLGYSGDLDDGAMGPAFISLLALMGIALICCMVFRFITHWHHQTALNIVLAISASVTSIIPALYMLIKNPKRIFSYLTLVVCLFVPLTHGIYEERVFQNDEKYINPSGFLYSVDLNTEQCSIYGGGRDKTQIIIPSSYYGFSVTSIGNFAFNGCSSLTSIEIPNSITSIGDWAFSGCSSLTSIEIPNSVTSIGDSAFSGCSSLTSIEIPNSVTSIGDWAFGDCNSLTSVTIGDSVKKIGDYTFRDCSSLASITIPNSVTSIGDRAFYSCSSLTSIEIPNSVTSIGNFAFNGCSSLTSIEIPNSITSIGAHAFYSCSSLSDITFVGNIEQWESVHKHSYWIGIGSSISVHCSDGDVIEKRS